MKKMIKKWRHAVLACGMALAFLAGCESEDSKKSVTGTVLKSTEVMVSQVLPDQIKPLDTLDIDEGEFSYPNQLIRTGISVV